MHIFKSLTSHSLIFQHTNILHFCKHGDIIYFITYYN